MTWIYGCWRPCRKPCRRNPWQGWSRMRRWGVGGEGCEQGIFRSWWARMMVYGRVQVEGVTASDTSLFGDGVWSGVSLHQVPSWMCVLRAGSLQLELLDDSDTGLVMTGSQICAHTWKNKRLVKLFESEFQIESHYIIVRHHFCHWYWNLFWGLSFIFYIYIYIYGNIKRYLLFWTILDNLLVNFFLSLYPFIIYICNMSRYFHIWYW